MTGSHERDVASLEHRRETKQQREARRLEKERVARLKERARSMRDEHVDGGYLVTQGVYTGPEDFSKPVVRQLMVSGPCHTFWFLSPCGFTYLSPCRLNDALPRFGGV